MTDEAAVDWPTCDEPGCIGIRLLRGGKCLAHATAGRRTVVLRQLHETGEIDARGVPIAEVLLEQILGAAPHDTANHPTFATARFDQVTFEGVARFHRVTFGGEARFDGATFQDVAGFDEATFQGDALFGEATFQRDAWFGEATFQRDAWFGEATFQCDAWFAGAIVRRDAGFIEARFEQARQLGPLLVYGLLRLDAAHFAQLILIEASSRGLSCQRTRFPAGIQFRLRWARVSWTTPTCPAPRC